MRTVLATLHSKYIHNSLALPCLAAYCSEGCGDIVLHEYTVHEPKGSILAMLLEEAPEVVGFSVYLWNRREVLDLVDALAVARPQLRIILGGPEVSFDGNELFAGHPGITALIRGEGEEPLRLLLTAWHNDREPATPPRTLIRRGGTIVHGPEAPPLAELDAIPSPFHRNLVNLERGFVYYETSRGCPFHCSFCLSARDNHIRSYSIARIRDDLRLLMDRKVAKVKLVDRTFNYDARRAQEIFAFILAHNQVTHFHFEIGAHLLDDAILDLLDTVPQGMFQFEIGVQSTLASTLDTIERKDNLDKLVKNVRRLVEGGRVHLHLDLVAGLPGDRFASVLASIDQVIDLRPHHLQIEPVKLLPGTPLRDQAASRQIRFDPNPPYTILDSPDFPYADLQQLQHLSRLLDLTYNSGCFNTFLTELTRCCGTFSAGLNWLATAWHERGLFRFPMNRQTLFFAIADILRTHMADDRRLVESLAYDYARCERVVTSRIPDFFDTALSGEEQDWVRAIVQHRGEEVRGKGIKLQYFACRFAALENAPQSDAFLFLYLTQTGVPMQVEEYRRGAPHQASWPASTIVPH